MVLWLQFMACTGIILVSGIYLSKYGDIIAEKTGLGRTWVGVVLMASVTSLPELVTGISSVALSSRTCSHRWIRYPPAGPCKPQHPARWKSSRDWLDRPQ